MSNVIYLAYYFKAKPLQPAVEILIAELGYAGFESFVETHEGVTAYIQKDDWYEAILDAIHVLSSEEFDISYTSEEIAQTNWNAEWEKNFNPIVVDNRVTVRAPFHKVPKTEYDIVIEPKMSFGTGHHETTHMMIEHMLNIDFKNKIVLDMGCGTGILAIFAEMKGAKQIDAIDIDEWCYLNSLENVEKNNCKTITTFQGDSSLLNSQEYDIILANINRNILLQDIPVYKKQLVKGGLLILSGFYDNDLNLINSKCQENDLKYKSKLIKNSWTSVIYIFE